jgi:tryptophan synthase alpha chain
MANRIMAHLVAFYPDEEASLEVARGLADGGAAYLEVQFPFSEPTADGPVIQTACARALERGFTVARGLKLLEKICALTSAPVFVMSYANVAYRAGIPEFTRRVREAGAHGLIVPDLSPGADEGLFAAGSAAGIAVVPVIVPTMSDARLAAVRAERPAYLYTALRTGITGAATEVGADTLAFLARAAGGGSGPKILAGFGISEKGQADLLAPHVHAVVVGSAFVSAIAAADGTPPYAAVRGRIESLR